MNNNNILFYIGLYYESIVINENKMIEYYLMAIDKGNSDAMYYLGTYYDTIENYDLMVKYYLMHY